jgi:O-acetyl-ADP-ribose deacetylase (regulator of RNase III)
MIMLCERDRVKLEYAEREFGEWSGIEFVCDDIENVIDTCDVLISASNSRLYLDGGSDLAFMKKYPQAFDMTISKLHNSLKYNKRLFGLEMAIPHLPVGAAMKTKIGKHIFINSPTMILPQNVVHTNNAYYSCKAALELLDKIEGGYDRALITLMCAGVGGMDPRESARQMKMAIDDHSRGIKFDVIPNEIDFVHIPGIMKNQPKYYSNGLYIDVGIDEMLSG